MEKKLSVENCDAKQSFDLGLLGSGVCAWCGVFGDDVRLVVRRRRTGKRLNCQKKCCPKWVKVENE